MESGEWRGGEQRTENRERTGSSQSSLVDSRQLLSLTVTFSSDAAEAAQPAPAAPHKGPPPPPPPPAKTSRRPWTDAGLPRFARAVLRAGLVWPVWSVSLVARGLLVPVGRDGCVDSGLDLAWLGLVWSWCGSEGWTGVWLIFFIFLMGADTVLILYCIVLG